MTNTFGARSKIFVCSVLCGKVIAEGGFMNKATLYFQEYQMLVAFIIDVSPSEFDIKASDISLTGLFSDEQIKTACKDYQASVSPIEMEEHYD